MIELVTAGWPQLERLCELAVTAAWQGSVLLLAASIAIWALRPRRSSTRYAAWLAVLILIVLLPFRALVVDPVPEATTHESAAVMDRVSSPIDESRSLPGGAMPPTSWSAAPASWIAPAPVLVSLPASLLTLACLAFVVLVGGLSLFRFASIASGIVQVGRIRATCSPIPEDLESRLVGWREVRGNGRTVRLSLSPAVDSPVAIGYFRPRVVLPEALLETLSPAEIDLVVLHELAHLRRGDDWLVLLQRLIEAVAPWQPAIWWVGRRLAREREAACDEWVVARTAAPHAYARCLLRMAELRLATPPTLSLGLGSSSMLAERVERLVRPHPARRPAAVAVGMLLASALSVAAFARSIDLTAGSVAAPSRAHPDAPDAGVLRAAWTRNDARFTMTARGEIRFEGDQPVDIERGGYYTIAVERDGVVRRVEYVPRADGTLARTLWVGHEPRSGGAWHEGDERAALEDARRAYGDAWERALRSATREGVARDADTGEDPLVRQAAEAALAGRAGSIVVMDPRTGRVLAAVNQDWAFRRAVSPASTVKLVTATGLLEEGLLDPLTPLRGAQDAEPLSLTDAIARSDNAYFQMTGARLGPARFLAYAAAFGLGEPAGVPGGAEPQGPLPSEAATRASIVATGDGIEMTPLQLACYISAFANGGIVPAPAFGATPESASVVIRRDLRPMAESLAGVLPGLRGAVRSGTARMAYDPAIPIAGKTGTARSRFGQTGLFASFLDVPDSPLVVVVHLEGVDVTGAQAASIAHTVYGGIAATAPDRLAPRRNVASRL